MAHKTPLSLVLASMAISLTAGLTTCPGFPGFCSESFPGHSCNVVCDFGRNNVPLCQDDGTWTDIPRCIEHDPGVEEQIPGTCPSIPGYCAQGFLNTRCKFDCVTGADIDSICSQDGTWAPYPTCDGDLRETRDGCDGCPGPIGGSRNRTAEAIVSRNTVSDRRVPKVIRNNSGIKNVPSFAGNINIGRLNPTEKPVSQNRFRPTSQAPRATSPPARQPQQQLANNQNFQTNFNQRPQQPQRPFTQQPQRQPQQPPRQFVQPQQPQRQPIQQQFSQQPKRQQPQQQFAQQPQQSFNQGLNTFQPGSEASQPLSLFDQIKNKINQGNAQEAQQARQQPPRRQQQQQPQSFQQPQPTFQQQPQQNFQAQPASASSFGVFEQVNLGERFGGPNPSQNPPPARRVQRPQPQEDGFFGVFSEIKLQL